MSQKVLNEAQLREYVEQEVRKTLVSEGIDENITVFLSNVFNI